MEKKTIVVSIVEGWCVGTHCSIATLGIRGVSTGSHLFHPTRFGKASFHLHSSILSVPRQARRLIPSMVERGEKSVQGIRSTTLERWICSRQ